MNERYAAGVQERERMEAMRLVGQMADCLGFTLRDLFAWGALAGGTAAQSRTPLMVAARAYQIADAMLTMRTAPDPNALATMRKGSPDGPD